MSATNTTTNLGLSQFGNTDVPAWRQDYNGDMLKIDNAYTADISSATAETSADPSDYMKFYDVSATTNKKILISDLLKGAKVEDLTDTDITTPVDDDGLVYDSTAQKWENVPIMTKGQWKKNGAYNILENKGVSQVISTSLTNITVTKQANGEMWIYGTTTTNPIYIYLNTIVNCDEDYMLVGTPTSAVPNYDYHVFAPIYNKSDDSLADTAIDYGQGVIVPKNAGRYCTPQITIKANQTISSDNPIKFKPMMTTDLTATYADYVPYAKTNRELTEAVTTKVGSLSPSQYTTSAENVKVRQVGNSVHIWGFCNNNIQHSDGSNNNVLGTITGVTMPKTDEAVRTVCGIAAHAYDIPQQVGYLSLATNGELIFKTTQTGTKSVYFDISYAV